jgi:hypothetical protein
MNARESEGDAIFRDPLPKGFYRRVLRVAPGSELSLEPDCLRDAIVTVEEGELELECGTGSRQRFGRDSMIAIARFPITHLRSVGADPLVLVTVSRTSLPATDEFLRDRGSYFDC